MGKDTEGHRPVTRSRQRLQAPVEAHRARAVVLVASKKRASGKSVEPFGKTDAVLATKYVITATRIQTCVQPERMGARSTETMGKS